jgi:hypothetical protein
VRVDLPGHPRRGVVPGVGGARRVTGHPLELRGPVLRQVRTPDHAPAPGEQEHQVEAGVGVLVPRRSEVGVPVVGAAHHAVPEPVGGGGELQRHVGPGAVGARREERRCAPVEETRERRPVGQSRQEVVHGDPLVVQFDELAGPLEAAVPGDRVTGMVGEPVDDRVVELEETQVQLRDDEVLVVAGVPDEGDGARRPREVVPGDPGVRGLVRGVVDPERHAVDVGHLVRADRPRPHAVDGVEVQRRLPQVAQRRHHPAGGRGHERGLGDADVDVAVGRRRQVVVDELPPVGVDRRDARVTFGQVILVHHGRTQCLQPGHHGARLGDGQAVLRVAERVEQVVEAGADRPDVGRLGLVVRRALDRGLLGRAGRGLGQCLGQGVPTVREAGDDAAQLGFHGRCLSRESTRDSGGGCAQADTTLSRRPSGGVPGRHVGHRGPADPAHDVADVVLRRALGQGEVTR